MRFLADAGVSPDTIAFLTRLGHDAIHVRALEMHRAQDRELVDYARSEGRVIVTFDLDFGDILALGVLDRPSVIRIGCGEGGYADAALSRHLHHAPGLALPLHVHGSGLQRRPGC